MENSINSKEIVRIAAARRAALKLHRRLKTRAGLWREQPGWSHWIDSAFGITSEKA